jgi:hypothetical protein
VSYGALTLRLDDEELVFRPISPSERAEEIADYVRGQLDESAAELQEPLPGRDADSEDGKSFWTVGRLIALTGLASVAAAGLTAVSLDSRDLTWNLLASGLTGLAYGLLDSFGVTAWVRRTWAPP